MGAPRLKASGLSLYPSSKRLRGAFNAARAVLNSAASSENARVAQLVEHITDTDGVPGSNPGARTKRNPLRLQAGGFLFVRAQHRCGTPMRQDSKAGAGSRPAALPGWAARRGREHLAVWRSGLRKLRERRNGLVIRDRILARQEKTKSLVTRDRILAR